jgi:hypothetical protein
MTRKTIDLLSNATESLESYVSGSPPSFLAALHSNLSIEAGEQVVKTDRR